MCIGLVLLMLVTVRRHRRRPTQTPRCRRGAAPRRRAVSVIVFIVVVDVHPGTRRVGADRGVRADGAAPSPPRVLVVMMGPVGGEQPRGEEGRVRVGGHRRCRRWRCRCRWRRRCPSRWGRINVEVERSGGLNYDISSAMHDRDPFFAPLRMATTAAAVVPSSLASRRSRVWHLFPGSVCMATYVCVCLQTINDQHPRPVQCCTASVTDS